MRITSKEWRESSQSVKQVFFDQYAKDKSRYEIELAEYFASCDKIQDQEVKLPRVIIKSKPQASVKPTEPILQEPKTAFESFADITAPLMKNSNPGKYSFKYRCRFY